MRQALRFNRIDLITESRLFRQTVTILILVNAIIVGLETYPEVRARYGEILNLADSTILYLFVLELILRFLAVTPHYTFFRSVWNIFDLVIVGAGFLPSSEFITVARLFRIFRVLRAVSVMPDLQRVVADSLRPRQNISAHYTTACLRFLASSHWKDGSRSWTRCSTTCPLLGYTSLAL